MLNRGRGRQGGRRGGRGPGRQGGQGGKSRCDPPINKSRDREHEARRQREVCFRGPYETGKWRADAVDLSLKLLNQRVVDVAKSMSDVHAISDLGQRAATY